MKIGYFKGVNKQKQLDAEILLNVLNQLKENNSALSDLPEIHRLREQLNECVNEKDNGADKEFEYHIEEVKEFNPEIKIIRALIFDRCDNLIARLDSDYSDKEYKEFIQKLNLFENYYSGYGEQELYGYIWYNNGTWSERREYDGSEWWEYKKTPIFNDILSNLKNYKNNIEKVS